MNETRDLAAAVLQLERERDALAGQLAAERIAREAAEGRAAAAAAAAAGAGVPSATATGVGGPGAPSSAAAAGLPPYVLSDEDQRAALELRVAAYIRARDIDVPFPLAPDEEAAPGATAAAAATAAARGDEEAAAAAMLTAADCLRRTVAVLGLRDVSEGYAAAAMLREAMQVLGGRAEWGKGGWEGVATRGNASARVRRLHSTAPQPRPSFPSPIVECRPPSRSRARRTRLRSTSA